MDADTDFYIASMQVDKGAAARFIKAALADDQQDEGKSVKVHMYGFGQLMRRLSM